MRSSRPAGRVRDLNPHAEQYDLATETERIPEPEPTELEAALARWANAPETDSLRALRSLADRIEELERRAAALAGEQAEAVLAADAEAEDAALSELATIERRIEARLEAVPVLEERIRAEVIEAYEAKRRLLGRKLEEAEASFDKLHTAWEEAVKLEAERRAEAKAADGVAQGLKDDLRELGDAIDELK